MGLGVFHRSHRITAGLLQIALHFLVLGQRTPTGLTDLVRHLFGHGLAGQLGAVTPSELLSVLDFCRFGDGAVLRKQLDQLGGSVNRLNKRTSR
jgi:hypothetical protein